MSRIAFEASKTPAAISVKNKHLNIAGDLNWKKAAKFSTDSVSEAQAWVAEGLKSPNASFLPNADTSFKVVVDMGRVVGTKGQTGIRIMVGEDGVVFNCFPVNI